MNKQSSLLDAARDPLLVKALYEPLRDRPEVFAANLNRIAASGAVGRNAEWEAEERPRWRVEQQRYGTEMIQAGLVLGDDALIASGWHGLVWPLAHQNRSDGSFPGTDDAFHSVSIFLEAAARALLLLQESDHPSYRSVVAETIPRLQAAAHWLLIPEVTAQAREVERRFTHRWWILSGALGLTGALSEDLTLQQAAAEYAAEGVTIQRPDGVNPEKGSFDANYQSAGCLFAARYFSVCSDRELRQRIATMIQRGLERESLQVDSGGVVSTAGSVRVGQETGISGTIKTMNYKEVLLAFVHGAQITSVTAFYETAGLIAARSDWEPLLATLYPFQPD